MANVIFIPTSKTVPKEDASVELLLVVERDKEQELMVCCGWYYDGVFRTNDVFVQDELNRGYARVIGWGDLDECYKEARELRGM